MTLAGMGHQSFKSGPAAILIERLPSPCPAADLHALAVLLVDAVGAGSALSFLPPLSVARAEEWWRRTLSAAPAGSIFLVARKDGRIVGTVQMLPAWAPNQPHRADIAKLVVRADCRGAGVGRRLMEGIEAEAAAAGFRLLTLDTRRGDAAERLYLRLGWTVVGIIPEFALNADGTPHDTVIFYKFLNRDVPASPMPDSGGPS